MKNKFQTWTAVTMITVLFACDNKSGQINYLEETPVVATRTLIDGEEMIELDPALLKDTMVIPLSYFTEELQIIKLDGKDEALTGAPYAYVSDNYIMTGMSGNTPFKLFDRQGNYLANVGSIGQGPGEYRSVYAAKIDEASQRIYMLPFFGSQLLAYDFEGKACPSIPLAHERVVGKFALRGDTLLVLASPQPKNFTSCVWTQDLDGNLIHEFPTERLDFDFRGVTVVSNQNEDKHVDLSFWLPNARLDSLYEVNLEKGKLIPRFTAHFKGDALKPHMYGELPGYFVGEAMGQWWQSTEDKDGNIQQRLADDAPAYYIVDKQTLKGAFYAIENDFLGGERLENPLALEDGCYTTCLDPGELSDQLEKARRSDRLSEQLRKHLTKVQADITENDNNYILYAKLKQR